MKQFVLLLPSLTARYEEWSPEELQRIVQEYGEWAAQLGAEGKLLGGHKLTSSGGKVLRRTGEEVQVVDGPFAEAKEVLGGLFVIQAESEAEAVEVARTCPHLRYHEGIEVREIDTGDCAASDADAAVGGEAR